MKQRLLNLLIAIDQLVYVVLTLGIGHYHTSHSRDSRGLDWSSTGPLLPRRLKQ